MSSNMREFDLNIEKVLENWTVAHAIREIIANALDEQIITKTCDIEILKDESDCWHIRDFGRGVKYVHLTQNENDEKLAHPNLIGKFGVGLKDAMATFDRNGVGVVINSRFGRITTGKSVKHGFSDIVTLHAYISDAENADFVGTDFCLSGCSEKDIEDAKEFFLKFADIELYERTAYGEVYGRRNGIAEIFINGIKVAEEDNLLFSYNITSLTSSLRKAVNRERTNVGRSAYSSRIKDILMCVESDFIVKRLTDNLTEMNSGRQCDEMKWIDVQFRAVELLNRLGEVVFVTPEEINNSSGSAQEIVRESGKKIVYVNDLVKARIKSANDGDCQITTMETVVAKYNDSFEYDFVPYAELSLNERRVYDLTSEVVKLMNSGVGINQICISTRLLQEDGNDDVKGVWDPAIQKVIIRRDQLRSRADYFGTLIHELAHADSGADDVTRRFENELTRRLGTLASRLISDKNTIVDCAPESVGHRNREIGAGEYVVKCDRESSMISGLLYDYGAHKLIVNIHERYYCYADVSVDVAERMFSAESLGRYFNGVIRYYDYACSTKQEFDWLYSKSIDFANLKSWSLDEIARIRKEKEDKEYEDVFAALFG